MDSLLLYNGQNVVVLKMQIRLHIVDEMIMKLVGSSLLSYDDHVGGYSALKGHINHKV